MIDSSLKITAIAAFCLAYVTVEVLAWMTLVPSMVAPATFAWMSAAGFGLTGVAVWTSVRARATRSIAHVLHDVEHVDSSQ